MSTQKWFGGALVLSVALSLAMAGGAWAQYQERPSGGGSGSYGSGQGYQKGKKPAGAEGSLGICTPESCPGQGRRQGSGYTSPGQRSGGKGKLDKSSSSDRAE